MSVPSRIASLKFVLGTLWSTRGSIQESWVTLKKNDRQFETRVFRPHGNEATHCLLLINGFSAWGHQDPRMVNLGRQFANIGFCVVAPVIEDLDALRISKQVIEDITTIIDAVSENSDLCLDEKVSVFAPSYTAGMSLIACSKKSIREKIKALCCVGTYANIESSLKYVLKKQRIDNYGRLILMKNFLPHVISDAEVMLAIETAILDNGLKRKKAQLPGVLASINKESRLLFNRLDKEPGFRLEIMQTALRNYSASTELLFELNVMDHASMLNTSVCLIHGRKDNVIPPSESRQLHRLLRKNNIDSHLEVTPLIDHGDAIIRPSVVGDAYRLVNAFDYFIKKASS